MLKLLINWDETNLVCRAGGGGLVQALCVESKTEGGFDTRTEGLCVAEGQNTGVVDLGLDEGGRVEVARTKNVLDILPESWTRSEQLTS